MSDPVVFIRFERQGVEGVVPVGITLADAGRNFGIRFDDCKTKGNVHKCSVIVTSGIDQIGPLTDIETEHFGAGGRRSNERLACEARIIKPGEIVVMTEENTQETAKAAAAGVKFQEDFNSLPLDKKFANLLQMEVTVINEAVKFVADSSMKAFEKLGEVISDLGTKVETEAKKATEANRPTEETTHEREHEPEAPKE